MRRLRFVVRQHHREAPRLAVIAYGKLGGKELGYGSDLDVVFLYDDAGEPDPDKASEVYAAFVRKLIGWLTLRTAAQAVVDHFAAEIANGRAPKVVADLAAALDNEAKASTVNRGKRSAAA